MKGNPILYRRTSVCICCRAEATRNYGRPKPNEPRIQGIIPYISYLGDGKRQPIKMCPTVHVCDECLVKALQGQFEESQDIIDQIAGAILQSIRDRYIDLARVEA